MSTPSTEPLPKTMGEVHWRVMNSLICTVAWLENGCSVPEAVEELRLDIEMLIGLKHGNGNGNGD